MDFEVPYCQTKLYGDWPLFMGHMDDISGGFGIYMDMPHLWTTFEHYVLGVLDNLDHQSGLYGEPMGTDITRAFGRTSAVAALAQ